MSSSFLPIPRSSPAAQSLSAIRIAAFEKALERCNLVPRGYMLLCGGKVVAERFWAPYQPENKVWVYSLSKSFTSTGIGIAVDEGLLSVNDRVIDYFPGKFPDDPGENLREMRIRHLLSMNAGHEVEPMAPLEDLFAGDMARFFLNSPVEHKPGSHFAYSSIATFMLSSILQTVCGQPLLEYLRPRLLEPLGFDDVFWDAVPGGVNMGGWGLMVRLEDVAKLGQLYLNKGVYNGKRILSEQWVDEATSAHSDNNRPGEPVDWCMGYGYQFWRCQHGAFRGDGAFGQYCVVMPEQDMVFVMMSETALMQEVLDLVWQHLLPAACLDAPPMQAQMSGVRMSIVSQDMEKALGIDGIQFDFDNDGLRISIRNQNNSTTLICGNGCWAYGAVDPAVGGAALWRFSFVPLIMLGGRPIRTAAWYEWKDDHTLFVEWAYLESPHRAVAEFMFETKERSVTLVKLSASFAPDENTSRITFNY